MEEYLKQIRAYFQKHANEELVKKYSRFFTEGYDAYGVDQISLHAGMDKWLKEWRDELSLHGFIKLGDFLFQSGKYEEGSLAYLFIMDFKAEFDKTILDALGRWLENWVRNWAHTDIICGKLFRYLYEENIIDYSDLAQWRESASKWKRRAVPVSMLNLIKNHSDYKPYLDFIRPLMLDSERPVQQGLGWFLREAWKKQPVQVEPFLLEWKNTAPRLIYQYATEKMTKQQKELYRQEKIKK